MNCNSSPLGFSTMPDPEALLIPAAWGEHHG